MPKKSKKGSVFDVWCPKCEARQGHPCKSVITGRWYGLNFIHQARKDLWICRDEVIVMSGDECLNPVVVRKRV